MTVPTHFLQDILRQRTELPKCLDSLTGPGRQSLEQAIAVIGSARDVFLTGMGASWNAALSAGSLFYQGSRPVFLQEAGDLLHFASIPHGAVIIVISRTGRSLEIVQLLAKAKGCGASIIAITNTADSPLAREAAVAITAPAMLDHAVSVNAYSSLLLAAGALAGSSADEFVAVAEVLMKSIERAGECLPLWQEQLRQSDWLATSENYCFLARGSSLGSCYQAQLMWEEAVKLPATAMSASGFRHGPQEIVKQGMRFCLWIDQEHQREQDLAVAYDLRELGAAVMLIGENLPAQAGDLVIQLPSSPPRWQFAIDVFPIQLAADRLASLSGVDCDSFRICSYVVEDEYGLLRKKAEATPSAD